ncbi:response regulator [Adhaeribacter aquaticus]|uniref:response regulator n=1 Tax=Adhaeribacter aquaticus TaxID=299567 RepID=UPI0004214515|nr:response regulator [Adhaeribacter aquaticus]
MADKPLVLIADDDARNIFALKAVLSTKGYAVITATNGRECLEVLEKAPQVDIVLMDMMMPEMDGYEATQAIRKKPEFQHLPIIAVTAQAMVGDKEKCLQAGATDYISKPIDVEQLVQVMSTYITK